MKKVFSITVIVSHNVTSSRVILWFTRSKRRYLPNSALIEEPVVVIETHNWYSSRKNGGLDQVFFWRECPEIFCSLTSYMQCLLDNIRKQRIYLPCAITTRRLVSLRDGHLIHGRRQLVSTGAATPTQLSWFENSIYLLKIH